ncbi:DUF7159 family protein [Mycobacterium hubeiense]|uniref:DUF7159 family protein n=1 Tax=Mycobacterium hubeiense TaxID=1867256 RepID=UPI000C7EAAB3|nr:hypothetical protein [Mycobacterium sp. QGD 101]
MDAVLGLSVTPTAVGLVLVEGQDADGATMDRDAFEVPSRGSNAAATSEQAAAAVLRTEAAATSRGHRVRSIGVTWSDDADTEASLLLKSLSDWGFDNVVPVRLPEATEALARGIADVIGYETTAVCVVEPDTVVALIVHTRDGAIQTAISHTIDSEHRLVRWLSAVFTKADWRPEALVVVGSAGDLDTLMPRLEDALSVPVFAPAEAELALARGAALASAHDAEFGLLDAPLDHHDDPAPPHRSRAHIGPLALLAGGVVTFVVSVSLAISLQLSGRSEPAESQPAANTSESPAAVRPVAPVVPPPVAIPPPTPSAPPPPPEEPIDTAPAPAASEIVETVPVVEAPAVDTVPVEAPPAAVPPGAVPPAPQGPPVAEQVPTQKPPLLTRILGRLPGLHGGADEVEQPAPAAVPPPAPPPPPPPAPVP